MVYTDLMGALTRFQVGLAAGVDANDELMRTKDARTVAETCVVKVTSEFLGNLKSHARLTVI
jgi:hypothetical protein